MSLRPWIFLKDKTNREIMSWLGGGAAVIAAGVWAVFVFFHHDGKKSDASTAPAVTQSGTGIASGGNTVINAPVSIGVDEKRVGQQVVDAQKPLADTLEKLAAQVARDKGVEIAPLRAILIKLGEAGVADDNIAKRLDAKADELVKLREEIARLRQGPAELASFAQRAQTLIDEADFDGARATLTAAREAARKLRERSSHYEADFLGQEAKLDHLQLAYRNAAAKFAEAAGLVAAVDRQKQWEFVLGQANELYSQGDEFADNAALADSVALYGIALSLAPRSERTHDWAATQNDLGNALKVLGERESGTARLEEAIAAFRKALEERTRERAPLEWAETKNDVGGALLRLGERESGTARLAEAVAAYRDALTEYTRDRRPLQWAMIQNNLGLALATIGEHESGTERLKSAVIAYREVLKEFTRDRRPLQWAMTQTNLGAVLRVLGERQGSTAHLEQAVAAYHEALKEYTRERVPLRWALIQNNLGVALLALGRTESGAGHLEEALVALREALKEFTRARAPPDWAMTQHNLGNVLAELGERESGTARLEEAVAAYGNALKERPRERLPLAWARSTGNQGVALMLLAERRSDTEMARTAFAQIEAAFTTIRDGGHAPQASYYVTQLPKARALVAKLEKP